MKTMPSMKSDSVNNLTNRFDTLHLYVTSTLIPNTSCFKQVANPSEVVKMSRNVKRVKVEKRPINEEAMNNAFNKVCITSAR